MWSSIDTLKTDKELCRLSMYLLKNDFRTIGSFVNIESMDSLLDKIAKANYERVGFLPRSRLTIYKTYDIDYGYMDYMSVRLFKELIALQKVKKDIPIHLSYNYGNVSSYIDYKDIDKRCLLTDEIYLFVKEETNEIYSIKIGKPCNPNRLYYKKEINNITSTIDKVSTIEGLNSIYVREVRDFGFI